MNLKANKIQISREELIHLRRKKFMTIFEANDLGLHGWTLIGYPINPEEDGNFRFVFSRKIAEDGIRTNSFKLGKRTDYERFS